MTPKEIEKKIGKALTLVDEVLTFILNSSTPVAGIKDRSTVTLLEEAYKNLESFIEDLELDEE